MRIILWLTLFLAAFCAAGAVSGERLPVFEKPDRSSDIIGSIEAARIPASVQPVTGYTVRHPLAAYHAYYPLPGGGYASPELVYRTDEEGVRSIVRKAHPPYIRIALVAVTGIALALVLLGYVKRQSSKAPPLDSKTEACFFIAAIVLIRLLFLLNLLTEWNNVVAAAADETGYFETAFDMLHGRFAGPWRFTVGTGLLYLPFLLTTGAESFYDIAIPFSYFSAFVLAPGALVLGFAILRRLGLSNLRAALPIACWAVWPFVHFHIENWDANFFQSYFMIRAISGQWWNFYSALINSGFNAMSDTPGVCAILGCIAFALYMPARKRSVLLLGLLYGFACLLRINYILLAPALAYIAFHRFEPELKRWKTLLTLTALAAAGFLAVFGFQLWINFHQFGSPLTFGYILHYPEVADGLRPANGFTLRTFLAGTHTRFLAGANHALWALGITGLVLLRNAKLRTLFALWAIPLIWFFFGYSHTFCDARRFLFASLPALLGAFAAIECWSTFSRREAAAVCVLILLTLFLVPPFGVKLPMLPLQELGAFLCLFPAGLLPLGLHFLRTGRKQGTLLCILFPLLYLAGHAYLLAGLLALLLLRALCDWGREAYRIYASPEVSSE